MNLNSHSQIFQSLSKASEFSKSLSGLGDHSFLSALQNSQRTFDSLYIEGIFKEQPWVTQLSTIRKNLPLLASSFGESYLSVANAAGLSNVFNRYLGLASQQTLNKMVSPLNGLNLLSHFNTAFENQRGLTDHFKALDVLGSVQKKWAGFPGNGFTGANPFPKGLDLAAVLRAIPEDARTTLENASYKEVAAALEERGDLSSINFGFEEISTPENDSPLGFDEAPKNSSDQQSALARISTSALAIWLLVILPIFAILTHWEDARQGLVDISMRALPTETFASARNFIRKNFSGKPGDVRLINGADVFLRTGPSMKSEIIIPLKEYAPVVLLQKIDRNWALVSYEHEGYLIDGYVSIKFLKQVARH